MKTVTGSEGSPCSSNRISSIISIIPFTSPVLVHKFAINIMHDPFVSNSSASSFFAMSELAFLASRLPMCTACILATSWFNVSILILFMSGYVIRIEIKSENRFHSVQSSFSSNQMPSFC